MDDVDCRLTVASQLFADGRRGGGVVTWTGSLLGLDDLDALQLVSQAALAPVADVVDTNYTMVAKLPKTVLSGVEAFDGSTAACATSAARIFSRGDQLTERPRSPVTPLATEPS